MKRTTLLFTSIAGIIYLSISSYSDGPSTNAGHVAVSGCGTSTTCHGAKTSSTTATLTVKDGSTLVNSQYTPGKKYQVTITGSSPGRVHFGYQMSATSGSNKQAGSFSAIPSNSKTSATGGLTVVEHNAPVANSSLNVTFDWTAPAAGAGQVTLSASVNGVNGNASTSGDAFNTVQLTLSEASTSVTTVTMTGKLKIHPNPATNAIYIAGSANAPYNIIINDINGRTIKTQTMNNNTDAIDITTLQTGIYHIQATSKEDKQTAMFVKQ